MGLVNELQEAAERDDVLTVLRKAKRVSSKLGRRDISDWLEHEQSGYPDAAAIPGYRQIPISFCYNTNGYIPAGFGYLKSGIIPLPGLVQGCTREVYQPISTILDWIETMRAGRGIYETLSREAEGKLRGMLTSNWPEMLHHVTFMAQFDSSHIRAKCLLT